MTEYPEGVFIGFPGGRVTFTPVPDLFFSELLGQIDDLAELKLLLYCIWRLHHKRGRWRYLYREELEQDSVLLEGLRRPGQSGRQVLEEALERTVSRGALLEQPVEVDGEPQTWYFLNTERGRKAIERIQDGTLAPGTIATTATAVATVPTERPNIFQLYEHNIGLLQPVIVEELRDAAETYPDSWIKDAFRIAAENNVRNWRYVRAILRRWSREGREDEAYPRHSSNHGKFEQGGNERAEQTRRRFREELD